MKFVVVGGGTAGWLTALSVRHAFPDSLITVIESEEIGIIGAGEGTTPQILPLLDALGIPFSDLAKFCDATIKQSIKFSNWKGENDSFHHAFVVNKDLQFIQEANELRSMQQSTTCEAHVYASLLNDPQDAYTLAASLSLQNKIPFVEANRDLRLIQNPMALYDPVAAVAVHFNATKLAGFLRAIAAHRNIEQLDGIVGRIISDDYGAITSIVTDQGTTVDGDFFFDCTGFNRAIIGKHFKSKWISFKDILPADKAISYFKPISNDIPSHTEATAMKNGWLWNIPLRSRFGCGYVYSSDFTTSSEVEEEINLMEDGENIEWGRQFSFEAGCYEKIWIKNCMAVGLAAGFLEPLEATSILQTILNLEALLATPINLIENNSRSKNNVNRFNAAITAEIAEFLYLHYFTTRSDTDFWRQFDYGDPKMPEFVKEILEISKERPLDEKDFSSRLVFTAYNFQPIIVGNGLLTDADLRSHYSNFKLDRMEEYLSLRRNIGITTLKATNHNHFLNQITSRI